MRSDTHHIDVTDLEEVLRQAGIRQIAPRMAPPDSAAAPALPARALRPLAEQIAEVERGAIEAALAASKGNKVAAARLLGISRAKLYERLESLTDIQTVPKNRSINVSDIPTIHRRPQEKSF